LRSTEQRDEVVEFGGWGKENGFGGVGEEAGVGVFRISDWFRVERRNMEC
jgi:hypothetical protein